MTMKKLAEVGPPKNRSNAHVLNLLLNKCKECDECGAISHYTGKKQPGFAAQAHVAGRIMPVRRATFMAAKQIHIFKGRRITSRCPNSDCINPELLHQATPGQILKADYVKGTRSRKTATAHLLKYRASKLDREKAQRILADERTGKHGAADYGITPWHYNQIKRGEAWKQANPFAGLLS